MSIGGAIEARGVRLAHGLESQARELEEVARRMRGAAALLTGRKAARLSPQGREAISRAAQERWKRVRREQARKERAAEAKAREKARARKAPESPKSV